MERHGQVIHYSKQGQNQWSVIIYNESSLETSYLTIFEQMRIVSDRISFLNN